MRYIKYILLIWSILQSSLAHAQQYPVDVQAFVTLPYPQQLRSYWDTFENKIQTHLLLKDLNSPMRNVTLRFSLENLQGQVIAQSAPYATVFQTQLTAGVRKTLSNIDFKAVFALENLSGISENFYNDLLPEGTYFFCFTAYDATTQTPISNKARAMVQIRRYSPPLLHLPTQGEIISKNGHFQHIVFQWTMRDPAPFTQYEFTLKEVWDNSLAPNEAFLSGRLIYQGNVPSNTLLYGNDKPFLQENKRYAWRVRAFTNNPNNPNQVASLFKNNGESETFVFDYIANCEAPKFLIASPQANTANIRWQSGGEPPRVINFNQAPYKVLYREKGKAWKSATASMPNATLSGLKPNKTYIYKVGVACGLDNPLNNSAFNEQTYLYSTEQEFTTTDRISDSLSVQCGVKPQIRIKNREPLQEVLGVNETFTAGDFPITVLSATGSNGIFSGVGYVQVPYLADTKIKVTFDNIKINSERQLFDGKIVTTYDKTEKNVVKMDLKKQFEKVSERINNNLEQAPKEIYSEENIEKITYNTIEEQSIEKETSEEKKIFIPKNFAENSASDKEIADKSIENNKKSAEIIAQENKISANSSKTNIKEKEVFFTYKNKKYIDKDTIFIPYNRNNKITLGIEGIGKDEFVNWLSPSGLETTKYISGKKRSVQTQVTNNLRTLYYAPTKEDFINGKYDTLQVFLTHKYHNFNAKELYARDLSTENNSKREAKSGEILYLVAKSSLKEKWERAEYEVVTSPNLKEEQIPLWDLKWKYGYPHNATDQDGKLKIKKSTALDWKGLDTISITTGYPQKDTKRVMTKVIYESRSTHSAPPLGISNILTKQMKEINDNLQFLNKKLNLDLAFKIDPIRFGGEFFNEEIDNSPLYQEAIEWSITGSMGVEADKMISHPALLLLEKTNVLKAGVYIGGGFSVGVKGTIKDVKPIGEKAFTRETAFADLFASGCLEFGLKTELLVAKSLVEYEAKGYAKGCLQGKIRYDFNKKGIDDKESKLFFPPVVLGIKAKIKSKGWVEFDLVDYEGEIAITSEFILYE